MTPQDELITLGDHRFAPITPGDTHSLARAAEHACTCLWAAFVPFLLSFGQSPARSVLVGECCGASVVLVRRKIRGRPHLDFVIPPLARDPYPALAELTSPLAEFNGDLDTRMLWADLPAAAWAANRPGWSVAPYEREYVYRRQAVLAMCGGDFRTLRKRLARCERDAEPLVRPYRADDLDACIRLLKRWQDLREEILKPVFDFGYTRAALEVAEAIPAPWLVGVVVEVAREVRAFAFGGRLRMGLGNSFLLKSDPHVVGLAETARVALMEQLDGCDLVNDAGDLGRPGLAQHKGIFRPAAFVPTFKLSYRRA